MLSCYAVVKLALACLVQIVALRGTFGDFVLCTLRIPSAEFMFVAGPGSSFSGSWRNGECRFADNVEDIVPVVFDKVGDLLLGAVDLVLGQFRTATDDADPGERTRLDLAVLAEKE